MNLRNIFRGSENANFLGIIVTLIILIIAFVFVDMSALREYVGKAGVWAPILFIFLKVITIVVAPLSGSPLYPLVGALFGFWPGLLYIVIGDLSGYSIAFLLSRIFGEPIVKRFISQKEHSLFAKIVRHLGTTKGLLHVCLTCFAMPELIAYGSGLTRMSYTKFIMIALPFELMFSSILVLMGSSLGYQNQPSIFYIILLITGGIVAFLGGLMFVKSVKSMK